MAGVAGRVERKEGAMGRWDFHTFGGRVAGTVRKDRKEGGNGEGGFHRWNTWVNILFPSSAVSPS